MTGEIERRKAKLLVVLNCQFRCSTWLNLLRADPSLWQTAGRGLPALPSRVNVGRARHSVRAVALIRDQQSPETTFSKSNPKSPKITCAAFLPGAIDTPGPGWLPENS